MSQTNLINVAPQHGDLGIANAVLVSPGSKEGSVLWERLRLLNQNRMPPLASQLVDDERLQLVGDWIDLMQ